MKNNNNGYNGWKNFETWNFYLEVTSDERVYRSLLNLAAKSDSVDELCKLIAIYFDLESESKINLPEIADSIFSDLAGSI